VKNMSLYFRSGKLIVGMHPCACANGEYKFPRDDEVLSGRMQLPSNTWFAMMKEDGTPSSDRLDLKRLLKLSKCDHSNLLPWELEVLSELAVVCKTSIDVVDRLEDEDGVPSYKMFGVVEPRSLLAKVTKCSFEQMREFFRHVEHPTLKLSGVNVLLGVRVLNESEVKKAFVHDSKGVPMIMHMLSDKHADEYLDAILLLIKRGPSDCMDAIDQDGQTMLHHAARNRKHAPLLLHHLVDCDLDACDNKGLTPLVFAIREGNLEAVKTLHELGADPTFVPPPCPRSCCLNKGSPGTPLEEAIKNKCLWKEKALEIVKYLVSTGEVGDLTQEHLTLAENTYSSMFEVVKEGYDKQMAANAPPPRPVTSEIMDDDPSPSGKKKRGAKRKGSRSHQALASGRVRSNKPVEDLSMTEKLRIWNQELDEILGEGVFSNQREKKKKGKRPSVFVRQSASKRQRK